MYLFYLYLFFSIFFEISAQYIFKIVHLKKINYLKDYKNLYILIGTIFYALTGFFAFKLLKYAELIVVNIIWHILHFIILFLIGYFLLNEKLSTKKIFASILGFISLIIFMSDGHHH